MNTKTKVEGWSFHGSGNAEHDYLPERGVHRSRRQRERGGRSQICRHGARPPGGRIICASGNRRLSQANKAGVQALAISFDDVAEGGEASRYPSPGPQARHRFQECHSDV